jgi:hypothetical protein
MLVQKEPRAKVEMKPASFKTIVKEVLKYAIVIMIVSIILSILQVGWKYIFGSREGFEGQPDVAKMIQNLQEASGALGDDKSYGLWVGYMYKYPEMAADALNDFKSRVFQPNCTFRQDWDTKLPPGLQRPMAAENAELANIAYKAYLDCLANNSEGCIKSLDDARARFMGPGCNYLNPPDTDSYAVNYKPVFKAATTTKK